MPTCVPIKELKNTAAFTETVCNASGPVFVTKNGREAFVSMSPACYESLMRQAALSDLYQTLDRAEAEVERGDTMLATSCIDSIKAQYGL